MHKINKVTFAFAFLMIGMFGLGFSAWSYGQSKIIKTNDINVGIGEVIQENLLSYKGSETFYICPSGIVKNEEIISECGLVFNFELDNTKLLAGTTYINYSTQLTISGHNSSLESYCKDAFLDVNGTTYNKTNPFPAFSSANNNQIYNQDISVTIQPGNITNIKLTYYFTGSFYSLLASDLIYTLELKAR